MGSEIQHCNIAVQADSGAVSYAGNANRGSGVAGLSNNQITGLALAVLLGGMAIASMFDSDQPAIPPAAAPEPLVLIESTVLAAAFDENEIAASAKYGNGAVVRGKVQTVSAGSNGKPVVMVEPDVGVLLSAGDMAAAGELKVGAEITARCSSVRTLLSVLIARDCRLETWEIKRPR